MEPTIGGLPDFRVMRWTNDKRVTSALTESSEAPVIEVDISLSTR